MKKKTENVVFPGGARTAGSRGDQGQGAVPRGALHQAKSVWQRLEGTGGQRQKIWVR